MVWRGTALTEQHGTAFGDRKYPLQPLLDLDFLLQAVLEGDSNCVCHRFAGELRKFPSQPTRLFICDYRTHTTSSPRSIVGDTPTIHHSISAEHKAAHLLYAWTCLAELGGYLFAEEAEGCHHFFARHKAAVGEHQVAYAGISQGGYLVGNATG